MKKVHKISYFPSKGFTYNPEEDHYWEKDALQKEILRIFTICHECRLCFKYCESFPSLFRFIDKDHQGDVLSLREDEIEKVMGSCFQCKLCEVQCPYTPQEGHDYLVDFPKLVHRYRAQKARGKIPSIRNKILSEVDFAAFMARMSLGLVNFLQKVRLYRVFFEKVMGIHKDKKLPEFAQRTFESWAKRTKRMRPLSDKVEVVLFQTCFVQNNDPDLGKDCVEVLEKNKVLYTCVKGLGCCGMPSWEHGDLKSLRKRAKHNLQILYPFVEKGAQILVLSPTCAMMFKKEYASLVENEDKIKAEKVAAAIQNPGNFLWSLKVDERLNTNFQSTPPGAKIGFHVPCHLRAQRVGFRSRDILRQIPGVKVQNVLECCGHDGTYAMKKESYQSSIAVGQKSFLGMKQTGAEVWSTECSLAALQFDQHAGIKPLHPFSILARAYRKNGFDDLTAHVSQAKKKS